MAKDQKFNPIFLWILIFLIGGGVVYWLTVTLSSDMLLLKDWISIFGSYASLYGLLVVIIQFQSVKQTTLKTQEEISKITSITEWSRYAELASNIKDDIMYEQYSLARFKLHQIKQAMLSIPTSLLEQDDNMKKSQQGFIKAIYGHISSLDSVILDSTAGVSKEKMFNDMERVSDFFKKMVNAKIN